MRADVGIGPYAERGIGGNMRYIVFDYIGKGALYLVPENDKVELALVNEYMQDYPGRVEQIGVLETSLQMASHWWNIGKRLEKERAINRLRSRNADNL